MSTDPEPCRSGEHLSLLFLSQDQTVASGVLAGPVTVTGTQTITGTVVVV